MALKPHQPKGWLALHRADDSARLDRYGYTGSKKLSRPVSYFFFWKTILAAAIMIGVYREPSQTTIGDGASFLKAVFC
ncbi:MAG: hypothetical protein KAT52_05310 [Desulfobacterales bacterium]|jgi:hypothetical protein|nr:hypothetical protein [Desulfobacterales bacterium]